MSAEREIVLGIDFGTSYSSAGALVNGRVELVVDGGDVAIPTIVHVSSRGEQIVGEKARARSLYEPEATASSFKRILGHSFDDPAVRHFQQTVAFRLKRSANGCAAVELRGQDFSCEQLCGLVLRHLRQLAEARFGGHARRAIIAVPVTAGHSYIAALRDGARLAGLELVLVIREPIAGALAAGLHQDPADRRILVCDFGGGTFDATIMTQDLEGFRALACDGVEFLGGDDFDEALAAGVASAFFKKAPLEANRDRVRGQQLSLRCESVKRMLSTQREAPLVFKDAYVAAGGDSIDLDVMIERTWAEARWEGLVVRATEAVTRLLETVGWATTDVDHLVLVGGTNLVPLVRSTFAKMFDHARLVTGDFARIAIARGTVMETATVIGAQPNLPYIAPDATVTGPMEPIRDPVR